MAIAATGFDPGRGTLRVRGICLIKGARVIAMFGATGDLGSRIVRILREQRQAVRAVSRDLARLQGAVGLGAEPVIADLRRPDTLAPALAGVDTVVTTANAVLGKGDNDVRRVDLEGNAALVEAARRQGVRRFVFVSANGAQPDHPADFFRAKAATEARLAASGMSVALLQPAAFMEVWASLLGAPVLAGKTVRVLGRGENPVPFVATEDVARVAAALACAPATPGVERVPLGGPAALSHLEVVAVFARVSGRTPRIRHLPRAMLRTLSVLLRPLAPVPARLMAAALWMDTEDQRIEPRPLAGRLTTLEEFARSFVAARTGRAREAA